MCAIDGWLGVAGFGDKVAGLSAGAPGVSIHPWPHISAGGDQALRAVDNPRTAGAEFAGAPGIAWAGGLVGPCP